MHPPKTDDPINLVFHASIAKEEQSFKYVGMIYENDPDKLDDEGFEIGGLAHLVAGSCGRMLDPRRTPVKIVGLHKSLAAFSVRVLSFEDKGAVWQLPLWHVKKFQFQREAERLSLLEVGVLEKLVEQYDRKIELELNGAATAATLRKLNDYRQQADDWLNEHSVFFQQKQEIDLASLDGQPSLQTDLVGWLQLFDLRELDAQFAEVFVSNPASGELIKGHRMVLAEMGLCSYRGNITRDPELFSGAWTREKRALHILVRMAFVQTVFSRLGYDKLPLFRTVYCDGEIERPRNKGFVSTSFSSAVAMSLFESGQSCERAVMMWQQVPIGRLFMTYLETDRLNYPYREAEAVILFDKDNRLF